MKRTKIIICMLLGIFTATAVFSQKVDLEKAKELENHLNEFTPLVKNDIAKLEQTTDISSIKAIGAELKERSDALLKEVKKVYPVDDDYILDVILENAIANDIATIAPNTSNALRTRATIKTIEGIEKEEQARPNYFKILVNIKKYSTKLSSTSNLKKAKKLIEYLKTEHSKLFSIIS